MRKILFLLLLYIVFIPLTGFCQEDFNTVRRHKKINRVYIEELEIIPEEPTKSIKHKKNVINCALPVDTILINSTFGKRIDPISGKWKMHNGLDLKTNKDSIKSILPGIIVKAEYNKRLGYYVKIKHGIYYSIYGHLSSISVQVNQIVPAGATIGVSGNTGKSTGEHLHFSIKKKSKYIDPEILLNVIQRFLLDRIFMISCK